MRTTEVTWLKESRYVLLCMLFAAGCSGSGQPDRPADVAEIEPGFLQGYLAQDEYPNSLELLPAPPAEDSAAFARDQEASRGSFSSRGTDRWQMAIKDADLYFPAAAGVFTEAIGFEITEEDTPYLYMLLRRSMADAGLSTYTAKDHYNRVRPFMKNGESTCTPDEEAGLRADGSYPSGHSAVGWAWALILCEIVPERTDAILARGYEFCRSRVICNVHWQSDIDTGRVMGAAAVARLHADEGFLRDLKQAKKEVESMK